jgi:hypothetical protein
MRILTAIFSLLIALVAVGGCAARTQVKAKDNSATIAPTVEGDEEATTEQHVGQDHDKHGEPGPRADRRPTATTATESGERGRRGVPSGSRPSGRPTVRVKG